VRFAALALALAAFVFAFEDFVQRTWPLLGRDRAARIDLARVVEEHLARGEARGAPPSVQEVAHARDLARAWRQERERPTTCCRPTAAPRSTGSPSSAPRSSSSWSRSRPS
jgi:hypothetical protein